MDVVYDAVIGAVNLRQVRRTAFQPQVQSLRARVSGGLDASEIYAIGGDPVAMFESMDIAGVIAGFPVATGLFVNGGTVTIPWNRRQNGGTFAGGSNNFTLTGAIALTILTGFSATQGDEGAVAELQTVFLSSDGLTSPVTSAVNQALASQAFNASYALGPVYVNGSQLPQVTGFRVNTGLQLDIVKFDGGLYPVQVNIISRDPSIDVTFASFDALNSLGPHFSAMSSAAAYFRKKVDGGSFASIASTVNAKFSFGAGLTNVQSVEGTGQRFGQAVLRLEGKALTASAASAIP